MQTDTSPRVDTGVGADDEGIRATVRERQRKRQSGRVEGAGTVFVAAGSPWRGILLGLTGVVVLSVATPYVEGYLQGSGLAATYLPTGVFLLFLGLLGLNVFLRLTRWPLTPQELMLAYVTMLIPSAVPSEGFALRMLPLLVEMPYYSTQMNEWQVLHSSHIPDWMVPRGKNVVDWFFLGVPPGERIPWGPWVKPLALWSLLAIGLYLILTSLTIAFRKRWMAAERLQFPLTQIPLSIMGDDPAPSLLSSFFRNPLVWAGAALPIVIHGLAGLNLYFPVVPKITLTDIQLSELFAGSRMWLDPPFFRWGTVTLNFYWGLIGISYLLRSEVSLSVWAFEWFYRLQELGFTISGLDHGQFQYTPRHTFGFTLASRYQRVGAFIVASAIFIWASRAEIREMVRAAFGGGRAAFGRDRAASRGESDPFAIPWWSFWLFLIGMAIYFSWTLATGMSAFASIILLGFFLVISIATARIVAATGLLWVYDYFVPMHGLTAVAGTARIDPHTFTNVGFVDFAALSNRANITPQTLDGMKIVSQTGITQRHFFIGMTLGIAVAMVVSLATVLHLAYTRGAVNLEAWHFHEGGDWLFNRVGGFQRYQVGTNWTILGLMAAGGGFMAFLLHLHRTYLWWPFYPLGYLLGGTVAAGQIWFPVFLGWLGKKFVIRFAGADGYRRFKSVAFGLVIGEFIAVGIWLVIDAATGTTMHRVFPAWAPH